MGTTSLRPWLRAGAVAAAALLSVQASEAAILSFFGWGFSENKTYKKVEAYVSATGEVLGAVGIISPPAAAAGATIKLVTIAADIIDPVATNAILSGRVTVNFDSSYQVLGAGWFGQFGADPTKLAPAVPVPVAGSGIDLLQLGNNPTMASAGIVGTPGQQVFSFDWGPSGFVPSANLSPSGHFNIAGLYLYSASFANEAEGSSAASVMTVAGSPAETLALGTASSTYMLCASGYCGVNPVPEPATALSLAGGLAVLAALRRRQRAA